ncbi:MAG: helix-turn-helix domain-containing protein [Bacteroidota bacterium]
MKKFLTVTELAQELQVPKSWVYSRTRLKGKEQIPHLKCGKYCRFEMDQVVEWLNNRQDQIAN